MNRYLLPAFVGTLATITLVQTVAISLSPTEISQKAKQFIVRIDGRGPLKKGSGSMVGRNGNTYQVLTNWHVVAESTDSKDYTVTTLDGQEHPVTTITRLVGADLAIITFESNKSYSIATLGNSQGLTEAQTIHYGGYPAEQPRVYRFYKEQSINGFIPASSAQDGYSIIFTGAVVGGMSGSPLLDDNGDIIGVYGRAIGDSLYGIPINTVKQLAQGAGITIANGTLPTTTPSPIRTPLPTTKPSPIVIKTPSTPPTPPPEKLTLISSVTREDYTPLRDLLAEGKWKEADEETTLKLGKALPLANYYCEDLRIIDKLWLHYSNNRFGFSVQKKIYQKLGGKLGQYNEKIWQQFGDYVGWRKNGNWLDYDDLAPNFNVNAPEGHLPLGRTFGGDTTGDKFGDIFWNQYKLCLQKM